MFAQRTHTCGNLWWTRPATARQEADGEIVRRTKSMRLAGSNSTHGGALAVPSASARNRAALRSPSVSHSRMRLPHPNASVVHSTRSSHARAREFQLKRWRRLANSCHGASSAWLSSHYAWAPPWPAMFLTAAMCPLSRINPKARRHVLSLDCQFRSAQKGQFCRSSPPISPPPPVHPPPPRKIFITSECLISTLQQHLRRVDYVRPQGGQQRPVLRCWVRHRPTRHTFALNSVQHRSSATKAHLFPVPCFFNDCQAVTGRILTERRVASPPTSSTIGVESRRHARPNNDENMIMLSAAIKVRTGFAG